MNIFDILSVLKINFLPLTLRVQFRTFDKFFQPYRMRYILTLFGFWLSAAAPAQEFRPVIRTYPPKTYRAHSQNWAAAQSRDGWMYFANNSGVLEYDGSQWRLLPLPNNGAVRALAADDTGTVWVGGKNEFGYLATPGHGLPVYRSLTALLPDSIRDFDFVLAIHPLNDAVVFITSDRLIRFRNNHFDSWPLGGSLRSSAVLRETIYMNVQGRGLLRWDGQSVSEVQNGSDLKSSRCVIVAGRYPIVIAPENVYIIQDNVLLPRGSSPKIIPYCALRLPDERIVVGTLGGGLWIADAGGKLETNVRRADGLPNESVYGVFVDRQKNLWMTTDKGLAKIDAATATARWNENDGLMGAVLSIEFHNGSTVVGTGAGLFQRQNGRFDRLNVPIYVASLHRWTRGDRDELLAGSGAGLFDIRSGRAQKIFDSAPIRCMGEWDRLDNRLVLGLEKGIRIIRRDGERWIDEGVIPRVTESTRAMMPDNDGNLWITTNDPTVLRLVPTGNGNYEMRRYENLSPLPVVKISNLHGKIVFSTNERVLEYDRTNDQFRPVRVFDPPLDARLSVGQMVTVDERSIAVRCEADGFERFVAMAYRNRDGTYRLDSLKCRGIPDMEIYTLVVRDSQLYIGGSEGLFRYDIRRHPSHLPSYAAFVRQVVLKEDSVLHTQSETVPMIDYEWNSLTIHFSAASFYDEDATFYSYRMDGLDEQWSSWSPLNRKEYANLFEGRYRFHVRARDANGHVSRIDTFEFIVAPPWYRTWWFGLSALIAVMAVLWAAYRYRVDQLLRVERLRLQIASDLHDDVGSSLSKIALYSGLAESGVKDVEGRSLLKEIGRLSRDTIATMGDIVWAIDARNDEDLAARMCELAYELLTPRGIALTLDVKLEGELPADVRQNVYLIFKETLHNIVKHSNARDVRIFALRDNGQLQLSVADNGDGIPVDHRQGHGLRNMRMRAERIGGRLSIDHRQGTTVELSVSL